MSLDFHQVLIHNLNVRQVAMTFHPGLPLRAWSESTGEADTEGTCRTPLPQSIRELQSCLFTKAVKPKKSLYFNQMHVI